MARYHSNIIDTQHISFHQVSLLTRWLNKSPNLGNVPHKQGGIAETMRKCNGELGIKLATIVVAVTLVAKESGKAHWNAGMCQYQHSHWALIRLRRPNALCKSCWMLCIFCSWSYREACFHLCRRYVARVHILTLLLWYFANARVPMHFFKNEILGHFDRLAFQDCAKKRPNKLYGLFFKLCRLSSDMDKSVNA